MEKNKSYDQIDLFPEKEKPPYLEPKYPNYPNYSMVKILHEEPFPVPENKCIHEKYSPQSEHSQKIENTLSDNLNDETCQHKKNLQNKFKYRLEQENNDFIVTDEYLLDYLLKKYKLDKNKLICMIKKMKEHEFKNMVLKDFYDDIDNDYIRDKPIKEQYQLFKQWNYNNIKISKEELENYYDKNIRQ